MATSIRTEIGVGASDDCPVAQASAEAGSMISHVARTATAISEDQVTEEFAIDGRVSVDQPGVEKISEFDEQRVYRFDRGPSHGCICECIEQYGCPVFDLHARDGTLYVSFYAPDLDTVQEIVNDLNDSFDKIHVRQLTQTGEQTKHDFVFVDRNRLTDRQREVLETGYQMGYFDYPKGANAGEVAEALDISPSTFSEHLAAAQQKILQTLLES